MTTTITVVTYMMRSAFSLDSGMPLMFSHQKYTVTITAKTAAVEIHRKHKLNVRSGNSSFRKPTRYSPAETPLIGPVRM